MSHKTALYDHHVKLNGLMVDFAGWQMPLHYGSQIAEHHAVRKSAGIFDVSHMGVVDINGRDTVSFLRHLLANDIAKLKNTGDALYSCMLNENGGVIDDLIAYRFSDDYFRLVINAGCREKDFAWMQSIQKRWREPARDDSRSDLTLNMRDDLCLLALQGPEAIAKLESIFDNNIAEKINSLKPFQFLICDDVVIARTGYTGESGVEMMLSQQDAIKIWEKCIALNIQPCGLGARDTLRLEAGLNLYGADMNEHTSPLISNLSWTVSFKDETRQFIGRDALEKEKQAGISQQLVGLILESKGVLRNHQHVKINSDGIGEITSGSFSPTLNKSIALARIPVTAETEALIERRGEWLPVKIVKPRFL